MPDPWHGLSCTYVHVNIRPNISFNHTKFVTQTEWSHHKKLLANMEWWVYPLIVLSILLKLCWICRCLALCFKKCKEDEEEARRHYNPGRVTGPTPVAGLPPGHYYVINSETNSEVPPPPYPVRPPPYQVRPPPYPGT